MRFAFPGRLLARLCLPLCLILCLATAALVHATPTSPLRFKRLSAFDAEELSILALMQDRQGFIWIGTHSGGLYRYNGYQAVRYTSEANNPSSLPHDRVSTLFEDKHGTIWIGTQEGLARFNPASDNFTRFRPPPGPAAERIVKAIVSDGKNGMWLATWGGLQHFDPASGRFRLFKHDPDNPDSLGSDDLNALAMDDHGGLWVATWPGGLDYLAADATRFQHFRVDRADNPDPKLNIVRSLHFARDRTLWIGTETGVVRWDTTSAWDTRRRVDSPASRITALYGDRDEAVWAGTLAAGLLRYDRGSTVPVHYVHRANDANSLPSDNIRAVMHDRSGMLWIGTFTDGISLVNLNSQGFQRYIPFDVEAHNMRPDNSLKYIEGAPRGRLWLASNSGLSLFDPASGVVEKSWRAANGQLAGQPGTLSNDILYSLYQQPDGPLWVGSSAGLNRLDHPDAPFQVIHFGNVGADFINVIAPGKGGILWLGTGLQVIRYDTNTGKWTNYGPNAQDPNSRSVNSTTTIVEDNQGRVWMGSEWSGGGLDMLDPASGRFTHLRHDPNNPESLSDDNVSALYQDPKGRLWAGTAKGINQVLVDAGGKVRFKRFDAPDSIGRRKILAIRSDSTGQLWMSTAAGLLRLDPDSGKASRYTSADGLSEAFTVGTAYAAPDGRVYFGGVRGMTGILPSIVRSTSVPPQVAFTDLKVFNRSLKDGRPMDGVELDGTVTSPRELTLSGTGLVFSVEFAALHFTDPGRNTYAYRLAGFDRDWVLTDSVHRTATYTNLDPGSYRFEVKAANHQGIWNDTPVTMTVTIVPPWWQSWWFRLLAAVLVVWLLLTAYRVRVRHLTRRQAQLQAMVAARTSELEDSNARLAALSSTDGLTGINNRRGFDTAIETEWRRAARAQHCLALAMLDVDHFKSYNDLYGHQAGDECLRTVAGLIAAHARRTTDLVARYGGEEFALLAPATEPEQALQIAQGICDALQSLALPHAGSPYGVVTISVGVAARVPSMDDTPANLIWAADRALYRAKQDGRNRAVAGN
jgi:diguanylate cyclase (GGDEF)-like protein